MWTNYIERISERWISPISRKANWWTLNRISKLMQTISLHTSCAMHHGFCSFAHRQKIVECVGDHELSIVCIDLNFFSHIRRIEHTIAGNNTHISKMHARYPPENDVYELMERIEIKNKFTFLPAAHCLAISSFVHLQQLAWMRMSSMTISQKFALQTTKNIFHFFCIHMRSMRIRLANFFHFTNEMALAFIMTLNRLDRKTGDWTHIGELNSSRNVLSESVLFVQLQGNRTTWVW